jgi:hypothetical protein
MKSMYGIPAIGALKMAVHVALLQFLQAPHQSSLKYYQVAAQVAHQVVTTTTALVAKVVIMAKEPCKNQCMDLQMAQYTQYALQAHQTVAAAVHVIKIVAMDAPALSMALA